MFPDDSGSVAGIVGGIGSSGGSIYPLLFAAPFLPSIHYGFALVAVTMIPIVALAAWVFQPDIAERATEGGWFVSGSEPNAAPSVSDD
jgi:NNP family nitrate/nitrite transporter-like MFS transporter